METNKFRNSTNTRYLRALFYETMGEDKSTCLYTLKDEDYKGYPSLYKIYMECDDLTEYTFASVYLDGWEHWQMLSNCTWFKPFAERWREELELRAQSSALKVLLQEVRKGDVQASKYLLSQAWKKDKVSPSNKRGRPSQEEIDKNIKQEIEDTDLINEDYERILNNAEQEEG